MRRLIILGFIAVLLGTADISARTFASAKLEERAQLAAPSGSTVDASVGGFPFLPRLLFNSEVSHVNVHVENIDATVITFASVDLDLAGVKISRSELINDRKAKVTRIDHGTVSAVLTQKALSDALHVPVTISDGNMSVTVLGKSIHVTPTVTASGTLSLGGPGIAGAFSLAIPKTDYIPCIGDVTILAARIRLSCEITEVPPALLDAVQR